jgi:hypothetical protein
MQEVEPGIDSATNGADEDSVLDKENDQNDEHESEEIVDETVNAPIPRRRTRSQGKTGTFIIPDAVSPSDDLEDEQTTSKGSISRIKARFKCFHSLSIREQSPKSLRTQKSCGCKQQGIGLIQSKTNPQAETRETTTLREPRPLEGP